MLATFHVLKSQRQLVVSTLGSTKYFHDYRKFQWRALVWRMARPTRNKHVHSLQWVAGFHHPPVWS